MSAETRVICNHEGVKEGAHIIHAVGCTDTTIFEGTPKPKVVHKPTPIGAQRTTPFPTEVYIQRSGGT